MCHPRGGGHSGACPASSGSAAIIHLNPEVALRIWLSERSRAVLFTYGVNQTALDGRGGASVAAGSRGRAAGAAEQAVEQARGDAVYAEQPHGLGDVDAALVGFDGGDHVLGEVGGIDGLV